MNNDELEKLLRKIVREETEPIDKRLDTLEKNMATKADLEAVKSDMATKEDVKRVEAGQKSLELKLDQSIQDNADFINHAGIFFDEMRNRIVKRIETIEDHAGLSKN